MGARRYGISLSMFNLRYQVVHSKINSISTSSHIPFCLLYKDTLYKHTNADSFDDFPKISEDFLKVVRRQENRFRTFSEDFRGISLVFIS